MIGKEGDTRTTVTGNCASQHCFPPQQLSYTTFPRLPCSQAGDKRSSDLKSLECQSHPEHFLSQTPLTQFLRAGCGNHAQSDSGQMKSHISWSLCWATEGFLPAASAYLECTPRLFPERKTIVLEPEEETEAQGHKRVSRSQAGHKYGNLKCRFEFYLYLLAGGQFPQLHHELTQHMLPVRGCMDSP